ncbi:MAG: hypothetical protein AAF465_05170 [Pseudomonadota bacterium]
MNIVLATCLKQPDISVSDQVLADALRRTGCDVSGVPWNGDWQPFAEADAVIIRTTWDYFEYYPEFTQWLDKLVTADLFVANPLPVLRWNAHKQYLFDLIERGAPVLPMMAVEHDAPAIAQLTTEQGWDKAVLKCLISGTARGLSRFQPADLSSIERALEVASPWSEYGLMVQPFMPQIQDHGEVSMVFIDDVFSHAVLKTPKENEFRIQSEFGGRYARVEPETQWLDAASDCLEAARAATDSDTLYARVDGLVVDGQFKLMELELTEPELMFNLAPESANRLADAVRQRLT